MSIEKPSRRKPDPTEIAEAELKKVAGGTDAKPADKTVPTNTDPKLGIGSQSTGAGAGKVSFNPF